MRSQLGRFIGERLDGDPPAGEIGHFYLCKACQQAVDRRDLGAVFHHEIPGHQPLPADDAERLLRITEQPNATLQRGGRHGAE
jgi:hypothetical protein